MQSFVTKSSTRTYQASLAFNSISVITIAFCLQTFNKCSWTSLVWTVGASFISSKNWCKQRLREWFSNKFVTKNNEALKAQWGVINGKIRARAAIVCLKELWAMKFPLTISFVTSLNKFTGRCHHCNWFYDLLFSSSTSHLSASDALEKRKEHS